MDLNGIKKGIHSLGEWIILLVYTNVLWLFFTLIGLGIFGVMPATVGVFTLLRQRIMGNETEPGYKIFFESYRKEFWKSNGFGFIFIVVGIMFRLDLEYFQSSSHILFQALWILVVVLSIFYFVILLNFFPVYVHFDIPFFDYFKYALLIGLTQISSTIMMVIGFAIIFYLFWYVSGLIPLFSVSLLSLNTMWFAYRSFIKIELRNEASESN